MNNINDYYIQAQLAQAAYANLPKGDPDKIELRFNAGMSAEQAETFAKNWQVIDQHSGITGASATVFEEKSSGRRYLAIRGTELGVGDLSADLLLAVGFPTFLNPQFIELQTQVGEWLSDQILSPKFSEYERSNSNQVGIAA